MSEENFEFKAWQKRARHNTPNDIANVTKSGNIVVSDNLYDRYFSLEFFGVELFVDEKQKAIGIQPSKNKSEAIKFHMVGKTKAKTLNVRNFIAQHNIEPQQYSAKWSEKYKMLIFNYKTLPSDITK